MFLHLGGDVIVSYSHIIAILDLYSTKNSSLSSDFLTNVLNDHEIIKISEDGKEKTLVITDKAMYISPISSYTLLKRSQNNNFENDAD
ncbi:MAG: DUF370 domain-containing protein [Peptococcaceae bacterium]|nr:DUF370 domain-containing protein [Peptococcaceae bacterium]